MKIIWIGVCISLLSTCLKTKEKTQDKSLITFQVNIFEHQPYCGGALPSKEQEKGSYLVLQDNAFLIKRGIINNDSIPIIKEIVTDQNGMFETKLPSGTYCLIFPAKHQSFNKFYEIESKESPHLKAGSRSCFEKWWRSPDAFLHITDTTKYVKAIIKSKCNTGFNPCMVYTGPKRP